jgi:hypothetical protein
MLFFYFSTKFLPSPHVHIHVHVHVKSDGALQTRHMRVPTKNIVMGMHRKTYDQNVCTADAC